METRHAVLEGLGASSTPGNSIGPTAGAGSGLAGLSTWWLRWSLRLVAGLLALLAAGYVGLLGYRHLRSAPAFDDPAAFIDGTNCAVSPDGKTAYVFLQHAGSFSYRDAVWAIDIETLEKTLVPNAALALHPFLPANPQCFASSVSWDGERLVGALMLGRETAEFFSIDLSTREVAEIDAQTHMAEAAKSGWRFERVRPLLPDQPSSIRASRRGADAVATFAIDTNREPAVPLQRPLQFFYTDSAGDVHHVDAGEGEDRVLPALRNPQGHSLRVSPDGRWLGLNEGGSKSRLVEVNSGNSRSFPHSIHELLPGDMPVLRLSKRKESQWTMSSLTEDRSFVTEVKVGTLRSIDSKRFLGIDAATEAAYVLDAEGRLLKTLRAPVPLPQAMER